ncbi:MAG: hypothetical protein Q9182_001375 [Xanthomendoza sp. 2 TL-2023]
MSFSSVAREFFLSKLTWSTLPISADPPLSTPSSARHFSETSSPIYPDRPIHPLPKRPLRSRLSPEIAESILYSAMSTPQKPLFSIPFNEPVAFGNRSPAEGFGDGLLSSDYPGHGASQGKNGYQFRGSDPDSDEDDANGIMQRYPAPRNRSLSQELNNDDQRAVTAKYTKVLMPASTISSQDSIDGYDSFENTNNKKKRKIPTSGGLGGQHSSLSSEMAHMGISPNRDYDSSPSDMDGGVGHYYGTGSSAVPATSSGTGISGAGRGRYGRAAPRAPSGRSPLAVSSNGSNALQAGRQLLQKQDLSTSAGPPSAKGLSPHPSSEQGIISTAIANAASIPPVAAKGQENVSLLKQQAAKKPASSKTQFTFTCDSDSARSMAWQEQSAATPAYHTIPASNPLPAETIHHGRDFATQGTQTSPNIQPDPNGHALPPQAAPNAETPQPPPKPRRSLAKQLALAARQRRLQQEYDNYHHPPSAEDTWVCEFCEYEMIFGRPPEALIRQYEIKDRRERRHLAEKRRLLEKAKMKGRKGKKGTKNSTKNSSTANPGGQSASKQRYDQPLDNSAQNQGRQSDEYFGEGFDDDPPPGSYSTSAKTDYRNLDNEWVHDRYDDDPEGGIGHVCRGENADTNKLVHLPGAPSTLEKIVTPPTQPCAKLRVDNLHYDLTEEDLEDLFTRIGPINSLALRFDRAGRSSGTAFVTYHHLSDARLAIREFDGANAHGQPIRLTLLPTAPAGDILGRGAVARNPFDTVERPPKSLFDRIDDPRFGSASRSRMGRSRSRSPGKPRRSDLSRPAPEGVDRYVPSPAGGRSRVRSRSPRRRREDVGGRGRGRGGERRGGGRENAGARPRKTQDELDKEMEDYWGPTGQPDGGAAATGAQNGVASITAPVVVGDDDIDMGIE